MESAGKEEDGVEPRQGQGLTSVSTNGTLDSAPILKAGCVEVSSIWGQMGLGGHVQGLLLSAVENLVSGNAHGSLTLSLTP